MTDRERLDDEDAQKVLARALELQARGAETLTVAQIREIAADLGVSESAIDQALSEHRSVAATQSAGAVPPSNPWKRHRVARLVALSVGVIGAALILLLLVGVGTRL